MTATSVIDERDDWQRLAPGAILFFAISTVGRMVSQGAQAIAPAVAGFAWLSTRSSGTEVIIGVAVLVALLLPFAILAYLRFTFRLLPDRIIVRQGVFKRRETTLTYGRVQNVNIETPFYFQPLRLARLRLDSAGSKGEEISLPGIPADTADRLRDDILLRGGPAKPENTVPEREEASSETIAPLHSLSNRDLLIEGLTSNNIFIFGGVLAALLGTFDQQFEHVADQIDTTIELWLAGTGGLTMVLAIMALVGAFATGLLILSVAAAFVRFYGYRLFPTDDGYRHTFGLLERKDIGLKEYKIQSVRLTQGLLARLSGRWALNMVQPGSGDGNNPSKGKEGFFIPGLGDAQAWALIRHVLPEVDPTAIRWRRISPRHFWRTWLVYWVPLPALIAVINLIADNPAMLVVTAPFPVIALPLCWLRWRQTAYDFDDRFGYYRSGLLGRRIRIFPLFKIHTITVGQRPGEQYRNLATIRFRLAGPNLAIPYIPREEAQHWQQTALRAVTTTRKAWI